MKKVYLLITLICILTSCTFTAPTENSEKIQFVTSKTSMKPFDNLEEPGVFVIGVYARNALLSKKKHQIGIAILVEDLEKNEIYDWCFYEGIIGEIHTVPTRMGSQKNEYFIPCYDSNKLLRLNPETSKISEVPLDEHLYFTQSFEYTNCRTDYNIMSMSATHAQTNEFGCFFKIFDSSKEQFSGPFFVENCLFFLDSSFYPDINGNIWFTQSLERIDNPNRVACYVRKMKPTDFTYSEPCFLLTSDEVLESYSSVCDFYLDYINSKYLFFIKYMNSEGIGVSVVDYTSDTYDRKDIILHHVVSCFEINDEMYFLTSYFREKENCKNEFDNFVEIYKFNQKTFEIEKLTDEILFWYLIPVICYGNKAYFFDYWNPGNIEYFSFDTETNTTSEVKYINFNEFVNNNF